MHFDPEYWLMVAALISFVTMSASVIGLFRIRSQEREKQLRSALRALDAHYDAVSTLVEDPAMPLSAKVFLTRLTEAISDQEIAEMLGASFAEDMSRDVSPESDKLIQEVRSLAKTRPDLYDGFHTAVSAGMAALYLRWPRNARYFQAITVALASDNRMEKSLTKRVTEIAKRRRDNDHNGMIGPTPLATPC